MRTICRWFASILAPRRGNFLRMPAYKRVSDTEIALIRSLSARRVSVLQIAAEIGRDPKTVRYWRAKRARGPQNQPPKPCKRVRADMKRRRTIIRRLLLQEVRVKHRVRPRYSGAPALRVTLERDFGIKVSAQTIRCDIRSMQGKFRARPVHAACTDSDIAKRLAFVKQHIKTDPTRFIFSDEKTFTCGDYTSRKQWILPGQTPCVRDGSSIAQDTVYIWAAIGIGFRVLRVIRVRKQGEAAKAKARGDCPRDKSFNAQAYVRTCLSGDLVRHMQANARKRLIFQADGYRVHYAQSVRTYLAGKKCPITHNWPPRSPDLNPIENLWAYMQPRVSESVPQNADELEAAIRRVFNDIPQSVIDNHVKSFRGKVERALKKGGRM